MGISVTKPTQKKALVPFQIRCYLSASSVVATLLTSFCDKITTFLTRMILERFCCILTLVHALSMASFQTIVHRASHTSHMFVMLLFPTLTTISICHSHYIPMSFGYFINVVDTTSIRNWISMYHPFSPNCIISFTTTMMVSRILCLVVRSFHDNSFPNFIHFICTLPFFFSLTLNTSCAPTEHKKSRVWTFCHCNSLA